MTVTLALLTFLFFVGLDYVLHVRKAKQPAEEPAPAQQPATSPAVAPAIVPKPVYVGGYELPDGLHYHRGHTWARVVSPDTAVVGVDDFARHLVGRVKRVRPPRVGSWMRQGAHGGTLRCEGREADLIAPLEGEVIEVNDEARRDADAVNEDPYGRGWLYKVRTANMAANLRNLLDGTTARRWTEDAREQLELRLMALSGSVLQDGGEPAPDFADHLDPDEWRALAGEFLLTEGRC